MKIRISDSIKYIGVDDKDMICLKVSILFRMVFHTTLI